MAITQEECELIRGDCQKARKNTAQWVVGIIVLVALTISIPLTAATISQRETNARQDERIRSLEQNMSLIREDVREIKQMVSEIYRQGIEHQ